jgi:SET domain-containing protein 6
LAVAIKDIEEGEELFTIPHTAVLSVSNSDLGKQIPKDLDKLEPWLKLVLVMISETSKGPESKWWPYLEMLPDELDTLAYWSPDELAELEGSAVVFKIGKEEADKSFGIIWKLAIRYHKFFGKLSALFGAGKGGDTFKRMAHRMANIIMAYAFDIMPTTTGDGADEDGYISDDEESYPKGMVPFADMLNADGDRNNVSDVNICF